MKEGFHIRKLTRNKHHYSKNTVFITLEMKGLGGAVSRMGAGLQMETMKSSGEGGW